MSEPVSNKDKKSKSKGPLLRVETAGDIPEDKLKVMTAKFAEVNEIADYRLSIEVKPELIGGFIIYFHGNRYDYSVRVSAETDQHFKLSIVTENTETGEKTVKVLDEKDVKGGECREDPDLFRKSGTACSARRRWSASRSRLSSVR